MEVNMNKKAGLERFLLKNMFENSLFADLSLVFLHPAFPFSMRFNVHRAIVSQSPFLYKLLKNMEQIPSEQQDQGQGMTSLTIDLATAWQNCGFHLAPFDHIIRRQWQKTPSQRSNNSSNPLLTSHIRFVLQWFYCLDKEHLLNAIQDCDTLCILSVAILMDVHDLAQACVDRYIHEQLSLDSIMRDLETICQLPKRSRSYLHLRDATLLLLFRLGPTHPARLAMLPVDYMADVLSADPLFITNEFERYSLLKSVLLAFMHSVGKISWTENGPVDENDKRLSGFVKPRSTTPQVGSSILSANDVRSRKRKRIPSEDFAILDQETPSVKLSRLSFTALVPFEKLVADASSGGVLDKATVLSYLLKTTVNYSNMTFDQLTRVRHDGIVDEGIVFRALWQREALERILYPTTLNEEQQYTQHRYLIEDDEMRESDDVQRDDDITEEQEDRNAALDEYFDVDNSVEQERRRRLLLGTPKFRFCTSVFITRPNEENGWNCEIKQRKKDTQQPQTRVESEELETVFDDDENDSDGSLWVASDHDNNGHQSLSINQKKKEIVKGLEIADRSLDSGTDEETEYKIYTQIFYSESEIILGVAYRLQVEAHVIPRYLLQIQDKEDDEREQENILLKYNMDHQDDVLVCRFELQRDMRTIAIPTIKKEKKEKTDASSQQKDEQQENEPEKEITPSSSQAMPKKAKIHYWVYCLNRHEGVLENDKVDPEDRMLVPVTEQEETGGGDNEMGHGYVGQVLIDANLKRGVTIDATIALEISGLPKV